MSHSARVVFIAVLGAIMPTAGVLAQSVPDLADLVGARAAGAETQMEARGYRQTANSTVRDMKFTFWWNDRKRDCVSVSTMEGRYASIQSVPRGNCDQGQPAPTAYQEAPANDGTALSLTLVCYGAGTKPGVTSTPDYDWSTRNQRWERSNTLRSTTEGFSSDVQIELYGDHGRIHLGPNLVPPIHSGGSNGWWDLGDLSVTPTTITASYRLNGLNKPRLTIDRRSGLIQLRSITDFSGRCDMGDWSDGKRRF